ncbi:MAG: UDP-glucose 4-epimerase GalE [Phycisphaerales bacterium]
MNILVTGAAGYIGSHATAHLLRHGHRVVGVDNLFRGHRRAMDLCARLAPDRLTFVEGDAGDTPRLTDLMRRHAIEGVMHFAARAYVGESVTDPLGYYRHNTAATIGLLEACQNADVSRIVFSSSCSTYGDLKPDQVPVKEDTPQSQVSPYGRSKYQCEQILIDYAESRRLAGKPFAWCALRYFNVAGCDRTGVLGEDHDPETHLIPVVLHAALGRRESIQIFGTDYPTPDGTCIRDYVHVDDLADAHLAVITALRPGVPSERAPAAPAYNLGIGKGYSVRQIIQAVERVTGRRVKVVEGPRRAGDPPMVFADPGKINRELGWQAQVTDLDVIVRSAWDWFQAHPRGYA